MAEGNCSICDAWGTIRRGMCNAHYQRWRRHGDPLAIAGVQVLHKFARTDPCQVEGCPGLAVNRGWCWKHYERWRAHGDAAYEVTPAERFEAKVDRVTDPGGCHIWMGARNEGGYGLFGVGGRVFLAHRWALQQDLGRSLPPDLLACHHCDNPPCVRIKHLYEGTASDNTRDAIMRGRHRNVRGR